MEPPATEDLLAERLADLHRRIEAAAQRAGRKGDEVTVIAVTKSAPATIFTAAQRAGIRDVGENRIQDALLRMAGHEHNFRWHFVGPLQSNKVRKAVAAFDVLHGVDSVELLARIERVAGELGRSPEILLQVNVSGESTKQGLPPAAVAAVVEAATALRHVRLAGLMTMAPASPDPARSRAVFAGLAALRDALGGRESLPQLSMGMSDDFEVAVEEGATLIRIGRRLVDALE